MPSRFRCSRSWSRLRGRGVRLSLPDLRSARAARRRRRCAWRRCSCAPRARARDVPVAARVRDRGQGAPHRDRVRHRRRRPARRPAAAADAARSTRSTRCRRWPQFVTAPAGQTTDRDRAFLVWSQTDLRAYRLTSAVELYGRRRPACQPLRAESAGVRHGAVSRGGLRPGTSSTRCRRRGSDGERRTCCAPAAASATGGPPGRRDRRPRDARLPDAAVHLVAESVSRVAAAGPAGAGRRRARPRRRVRRRTAGAGRRLFASGTSVWPLPDAVLRADGRVARAVLGRRRRGRRDGSASTS